MVSGMSLLHDNAPAHLSLFVKNNIENYNVTTLEHPPYSTDLGPAEFYLIQMSTCRNCGSEDRGRVAIYRPFGEFRRAKIVLSPVWCSRSTTGVPLAHATMNFVGLDLTTSDRWH
ncbi:hypothetical protein TNCV_3152911 [Trichonephila clavipes]|nr:hypothetical protein TNCV_3152911 [Trichonephila clavipes]